MVELLTDARRVGIAFDDAWDQAWQQMVSERAWPHRKVAKQQWRSALRAARPEYMAAYAGVETGYSRWHVALLAATDDSRFAGGEVVPGVLVA